MATLLAVLMGSGLALVVPAAPAAADSSYLCTGYAKCKQTGFPHAGYATEGSTMWWRMYTGHNCTNYVAYRLVRAGMANTRPWSGSGNATNWGVAMSKLTTGTPMVGAVAWWKAGAPGAGSSGHVAYVEQVVSSTEIVVSEDSWGGDFSWRRITKSGRGWPSGFIHFRDAAVVAAAAPTIVGTPAVGTELRASVGTWKPAATSSAVQWLADGTAIPGATAETFTPAAAQQGKQLSVQVTAARSGYVAGKATSAATPAVALGTLQPAAPPTISGLAQVDEVLVASPGSWQPTPTASTVQWHADGQPIPGATGWRLELGQAQVDRTITAVVRARAAGYRQAVARSSATGPVLAPVIEVQRPFALRGPARLGSELTVQAGSYAPADAKLSHTWLRDGQPIAGAGGPSYLLGPADLGARISVRVDLTRAGYRSSTQTLALDGVVRTSSTMAIAARGGRKRAVILLRLDVAGVTAPGARVTLSVGGRQLTRRLVAGRARVVVRGLRPGRHQVRVRYAGTGVIGASQTRIAIRVLGRR